MPLQTPTARQLAGLGVTLGAVLAFSLYMQWQISGLRRLQTETVDRNRRDSLQLVRIQSDLNQLGLAMRDMAEGTEPYPLSGYQAQFERLRDDLEDALRQESQLAPSSRNPGQQQLLKASSDRFWTEAGHLWALASAGRDNEARTLIRTRLDAERSTMTTLVSRLLVQNTEAESVAHVEIQQIYDRVERNLWLLLVAVVLGIAGTSLYVIRVNRSVFKQLEELSEHRKALAAQVITVQEDVFRALARELHDEFGQVLTAMGVMLQRVAKRVGDDSPAKAEIQEVREIANQTLERVRGMSQMLHPPVLDDYGLEKSIEWYTGKYGIQTGLTIHYEKIGIGPWIGEKTAIHVYRILQEALNNIVRHSGVTEAWVRVRYEPHRMELEVEDRGRGLPAQPAESGIGMIAMRERAGILGGTIEFTRPVSGGTLMRLRVPLLTEVKA